MISIGFSAFGTSVCESTLGAPRTHIALEDGRRIPLHNRRDGTQYIYLFPFLKTDVTFKKGEPYITVYRGIRDVVNTEHSSGKIDPIFGPLGKPFGDYVYTTLSPKTAIAYANNYMFVTPENITVLRMSLPLKKAYVAKAEFYQIGTWEGDTYLPALSHRSYIWFKWRALNRLKQKELVFNLQELGGNLDHPDYEMMQITEKVEPLESGDFYSHENMNQSVDRLRQRIEGGDWQ